MEPQKNNGSEREIKKIMIIGISVIMVAIVTFWAFNINSFINPRNERLTAAEQNELSWNDVRSRFDETMSQVVSKLDEIEGKKNAATNPANASSSLSNLEDILNTKISGSSSSSSVIATSSMSQPEEVKTTLDDMEKNLNKK